MKEQERDLIRLEDLKSRLETVIILGDEQEEPEEKSRKWLEIDILGENNHNSSLNYALTEGGIREIEDNSQEENFTNRHKSKDIFGGEIELGNIPEVNNDGKYRSKSNSKLKRRKPRREREEKNVYSFLIEKDDKLDENEDNDTYKEDNEIFKF